MSLKENDIEIYTYLSYLQSVFENLKSVKGQYDTYEEYRDDVKEFKKLYELSSELTQISTAYLGLNQGLPTSELEIIQRLSSMSQLVNEREQALGLDT
jgi:hypothetical protein